MGYRGLIRNHVAPHIGKIRIDKLTTHDIQQFYNLMKEEGRCQEHETKGYALASSTVRRMHGVLRQAPETAAMLRMIPRNPMDNVQIPVLDYRTMQVYNKEELEIFKEAIKNEPEWYDFFYTEITTGLRQGELCGLMWSDFDEKAGTLTIHRTRLRTNDGKVRTGATKTDAGKRKILLPKSTAQLLRERSKKSYNEWIFYNPLRPEEPMDPHVAYRALKRIQESAGLPSIRFHDLRHTFATMALGNGMDIKTLSAVIGHKSSATTLDIYAHTTDGMQRQAASNIERRIAGNETDADDTGENAKNEITMTDFEPTKFSVRRPGTGCITQINDHLFEGRYSPMWVNGKKRSVNVYAKTREECEEKLAAMIIEVKAEKERLLAEKAAQDQAEKESAEAKPKKCQAKKK